MRRTIPSSLVPAVGRSPVTRPSLSTTTRSETAMTSSRRWLTSMMPNPSALSCRISAKSRPTSSEVSDEVGSSKATARTPGLSAATISTTWVWAGDRVRPCWEGDTSPAKP